MLSSFLSTLLVQDAQAMTITSIYDQYSQGMQVAAAIGALGLFIKSEFCRTHHLQDGRECFERTWCELCFQSRPEMLHAHAVPESSLSFRVQDEPPVASDLACSSSPRSPPIRHR